MAKMTSDDFQAHVDRLGAIRGEFQREAAAVAADASLSPVGRQTRLAAGWLNVSAKLDAEMADFDRRVVERKTALEREVFAPPAGVSASDYRDALDRAERCDDEADARRLYDRAQRTGDAALAKAIATVGTEKGWTALTSEVFTAASPAGDAAAELGLLAQVSEDIGFQFARGSAMQESPRELAGLTRNQMRELLEAS